MAWCENPNCMKTGLRKADVEFDDDSKLVLCHGCMTLVHPGWIPPAEFVDLTGGIPRVVRNEPEARFGVAIQVNEQEGIKAALTYGSVSLALHIPADDYQRLFR